MESEEEDDNVYTHVHPHCLILRHCKCPLSCPCTCLHMSARMSASMPVHAPMHTSIHTSMHTGLILRHTIPSTHIPIHDADGACLYTRPMRALFDLAARHLALRQLVEPHSVANPSHVYRHSGSTFAWMRGHVHSHVFIQCLCTCIYVCV